MQNDPRRVSGILLPVFSLPSRCGVGGFSEEAYRFIDFLERSGQSIWQILPLGPIGPSHSPYQPGCCFAASPMFIDPETLRSEGLVSDQEFENFRKEIEPALLAQKNGPGRRIPYDDVLPAREKLRRIAYSRFKFYTSKSGLPEAYRKFIRGNEWWLTDYTLFFCLKQIYHERPWADWPEEYKRRDPAALRSFAKEHREELDFLKWEQYECRREWDNLHAYARRRGVEIVGDLPIYAALESSDCWAHPDLFQLDENFRPTAVSGCPPDDFAKNGQVWLNPLYRWQSARKKVYYWWIQRFRHLFGWFDVLRIDHFRGFAQYYSIPSSTLRAADGEWRDGPGLDFFRTLRKTLGDCPLIAEDLGFLTEDVKELIRATGIPGMRVLEFAYDSGMDNPNLPDHCVPNTIVYTGTHDNDTALGWYRSLGADKREFVRTCLAEYFRSPAASLSMSRLSESIRKAWTAGRIPEADIADALVFAASSTQSRAAVIPVQDLLGYGSEARTNIPGTASGNWEWQLTPHALTDELAERLRSLTEGTGRLPDRFA